MATVTEESISIENVGPTERLTLPYLPNGGVVCLRGGNDRGKTEALRAVKRLLGADEKLTKREGSSGRGSVEGFGVTITIGASSRQIGECEVSSMEGKFDLSDLIEPVVKDPKVADKVRIKTLLSISGAVANPDLFAPLIKDIATIQEIASAETLESADLVDMAARLKRDLERSARTAEDQAENAEGQAKGAQEAAAGVDTSAEADAGILDAAYRDAVRKDSDLRAERRTAIQAEQRRADATKKIERLKGRYKGPTSLDARDALEARRGELRQTQKAVEEAEAALAKAAADERVASGRVELAVQALDEAEDFENAISDCQAILSEATAQTDPGQEAVEKTTAAVTVAREAVERGALIRKAQEQLAAVAKHKAAAKERRLIAMRLRDAATQGVDSVLCEAVRVPQVRIKDGRVITDQNGREVPFGERSPGYRARVGVDIFLERIAEMAGGKADRMPPMVIGQRIWESLDGKNRRAIIEHAKERRVTIYTAEADRDPESDGEVRAEVLE